MTTTMHDDASVPGECKARGKYDPDARFIINLLKHGHARIDTPEAELLFVAPPRSPMGVRQIAGGARCIRHQGKTWSRREDEDQHRFIDRVIQEAPRDSKGELLTRTFECFYEEQH